jgi:hypothetical protein
MAKKRTGGTVAGLFVHRDVSTMQFQEGGGEDSCLF